MKFIMTTFILIICCNLSATTGKMIHIKYFQKIKRENTLNLRKVDRQLIGDINISPISNADHLSKLLIYKDELKLRQNFYDQLIFKFNIKYNGQGIKLFLVQHLKIMAKTELNNQERNINYWQFLNYLAKALNTLPEKNEDLLKFLTGYIQVSTISNPISPKEFLKRRHYSNSIEVVSVESVSKEDVGELLERRINKIEK
jgi:hypothetical protein